MYSAAVALVVFGAWAYAVNFHDPEHRLTAAVSQGMFSFTFSLIVMSITEGTFAWMAGRRWQVAVSIAVPVTVSVTGAALIHLAAHTPSIMLTLLGPALAGCAYQTAYVLNLRRQSRRASRSAFDS